MYIDTQRQQARVTHVAVLLRIHKYIRVFDARAGDIVFDVLVASIELYDVRMRVPVHTLYHSIYIYHTTYSVYYTISTSFRL